MFYKIFYLTNFHVKERHFYYIYFVYRRLFMRNKNKVFTNVIHVIAGLSLLILAMSLGTQRPSNAQFPPDMNGNNNSATSLENRIHQGENYVKLLAKDMENRLEKDGAILELTSMLPDVKNTS